MSLFIDPLVTLAGVTFNSGAATADNAEWWVTEVEGWGSPPVRIDTVEPTAAHGSTQAGALYGGADLLFSGVAVATTSEDAWAAHRRVTGAMPGLGVSTVLSVAEDIPMWMDVRQNGRTIAPSPKRGVVTFTLSLVAGYPFRRAVTPKTATLTAGGPPVNVTNDGTSAAAVSITAGGAGMVAVRQDSSGQVMRSRISVASGTVFDAATKQVTTAGGVIIYPLTTPSQWLSIPPQSTVPLSNLGDVDVDVTTYDTYT